MRVLAHGNHMLKFLAFGILALLTVHAARADSPPPPPESDCGLHEATNINAASLSIDANQLATIQASGTMSGGDNTGDGALVWRSLDKGVASYELMISACAHSLIDHDEYGDGDVDPDTGGMSVQLDDIATAGLHTIIVYSKKNRFTFDIATAPHTPASQSSCVPRPVYSIEYAETSDEESFGRMLVVQGSAVTTGWSNIELQLVSPVPDTLASYFAGRVATYQLVGCPPPAGADIITPLGETETFLLPGLRQIIIKASSNEKILEPDVLPQ